MYKVTLYRFKAGKFKWFGNVDSISADFEQYLNDFAKTGYELVSAQGSGAIYVWCIWKKV